MAITLASISVSGGNTTVTLDYNGTLISNAAAAGLTVGSVLYSGLTGLTVASLSGANITLTGEWSPAPIVGDLIGYNAPYGVIVMGTYSYSSAFDTTKFELMEGGLIYTGTVNVGDTVTVNGETRTVVAVGINGGGNPEYTVSGSYTSSGPGDLTGDPVTITPGGGGGGGKKPYIPGPGERTVPEADLLPAPENRVPENDLTPDVRDVPRTDLVPSVINKGGLIPS